MVSLITLYLYLNYHGILDDPISIPLINYHGILDDPISIPLRVQWYPISIPLRVRHLLSTYTLERSGICSKESKTTDN